MKSNLEHKTKLSDKIKEFRKNRNRRKELFKNLVVIKPSNKVGQALSLPKVLNLNPRSIYNKLEEFKTFVKEEEVDLTCMSESWEREELTLDKVIKIDDYEVISNVHQRTGKGGRPAIIVNTKKYHVENITNTLVNIPWGVEIVWAVLTPKNVSNASNIQKIVVASIYSKPDSRKKSVLLDHIAEVYNLLNAKYKKGLHWILCGDTNDLKLDPILMLNSKLKQVVQNFTRLNPPRILDPIITTLSSFYQVPVCLPPLDSDPDLDGKPSDHMMVVMSPISVINNKPARITKKIVFRPITDSGLQKMQLWLEKEKWTEISQESSAHRKAELLQHLLVKKYEEFFPEKVRKVSSDDQPFYTDKLARLKRKKGREYRKRRRSSKWISLENLYNNEVSKAKMDFYRKNIKNLRKAKPGKWYSELKKITSFGQQKSDEIHVESIKDLPVLEQAELIADKFAQVSQEYDKLKTGDIEVPEFCEDDIPQFTEEQVKAVLSEMDTKKSNVKGDVPARILKQFAGELSRPVTVVINSSLRQGIWPNIYKLEIVTPVPKVFPPMDIEQLRNISGLLNLDKVAEKLISKLMISDMKVKMDPSQYANQKGLSINHYLIKFIDRILEALDKGESCAVLATLVDWKQAFPRQCPKLGVESFLKNGVRPALIPLLINYFQGRTMKVKWQGNYSSERDLNGGGPQGSTFGIWEYLSQSNDNAQCVEESDRFKFVDDLSFLEIIYLLSVGIATYNIHAHVPSNIPTHNQVIVPQNLKTQGQLNQINEWTEKQKMKLNVKKTKSMIFNYSKKHQFTTDLKVNDEKIEIVREAKLLGTVITDKLTWDRNTEELIKKAYKRMQLLNAAAGYTISKYDLKSIYLTFIRSVLDQSAVVWHSSLTIKNRKDIERVQKAAVRVIMGKDFTTYKNGLRKLKLETLEKRREILCINFAKNCLKTDQVKGLFPLHHSKHIMKKRKHKKFKTKRIKTKRMKKSALPYMRKLLNDEYQTKNDLIKKTPW